MVHYVFWLSTLFLLFVTNLEYLLYVYKKEFFCVLLKK